jgi:hypothetical protein
LPENGYIEIKNLDSKTAEEISQFLNSIGVLFIYKELPLGSSNNITEGNVIYNKEVSEDIIKEDTSGTKEQGAKASGNGSSPSNPQNAKDMLKYFGAEYNRLYQRTYMVAWAKHGALLKKMITLMGADVVKKAIDYYLSNFASLSKKYGWNGYPTIEILWGWRETIFPEAEGLSFSGEVWTTQETGCNILNLN